MRLHLGVAFDPFEPANPLYCDSISGSFPPHPRNWIFGPPSQTTHFLCKLFSNWADSGALQGDSLFGSAPPPLPSPLLASPGLLCVVCSGRPASMYMWCPHVIGRDSWVWDEQEALQLVHSPHKVGEETLAECKPWSRLGNGAAPV